LPLSQQIEGRANDFRGLFENACRNLGIEILLLLRSEFNHRRLSEAKWTAAMSKKSLPPCRRWAKNR
jgi:hypothetical protein